MSNTHEKPALVFDVNETLLDIDALVPLFEHLFGRREAMREWFAQLVLYSQALSLADHYVPFNVLGGAVLRMVGTTHSIAISDDDVRALGAGIAVLPLHADVADSLARLGYAWRPERGLQGGTRDKGRQRRFAASWFGATRFRGSRPAACRRSTARALGLIAHQRQAVFAR
jgi:hypothetical protein